MGGPWWGLIPSKQAQRSSNPSLGSRCSVHIVGSLTSKLPSMIYMCERCFRTFANLSNAQWQGSKMGYKQPQQFSTWRTVFFHPLAADSSWSQVIRFFWDTQSKLIDGVFKLSQKSCALSALAAGIAVQQQIQRMNRRRVGADLFPLISSVLIENPFLFNPFHPPVYMAGLNLHSFTQEIP